MGQDKALLPFGGYATLAEYQYRRLLPLFTSVYLSAKEDKFPFQAPVILDETDVFAPTVGLMAAFRAIGGDFFVLSVDTPFVDDSVFSKLFEAYRRCDGDVYVAADADGSHPLCALYTRRAETALEAAIRRGEHRLHALLKRVKTVTIPFKDPTLFANLNTPREYEAAVKGR